MSVPTLQWIRAQRAAAQNRLDGILAGGVKAQEDMSAALDLVRELRRYEAIIKDLERRGGQD